MATYNGHQEDSSGNVLLPIPNSMATTIETGSTASQAYTKGSYFYYNNRLVKASSAIASGATLTIGSNIAYVNAADELSAHLRANDSSRSEFYFDVKDGKYGYYPSAAKTSSTFVPFGGTLSETTIWVNTRTSAFGGLQITLTSSLTNYDYMKIIYYTRYADRTVEDEKGIVIFPVETVRKSIVSASPLVTFGSFYGGDHIRSMKYVNDTTLEFRGTSDTYCWPTEIVGLK